MMRCRGTVILSALQAQSGGPVQNELTFREMVNGISALFAVMTPDGAVEEVNHAVLDYFGKTLEELKQWASTDAVHPVPPSITYSVPVMEPARGEVTNAMRSATSLGLAGRPSGMPPSDRMMICLPPS